MARLLCLETATDICSVALTEDDTVISLKETSETYAHAAMITVLIQACLEDRDLSLSDIDAVVLSAGPGSYTGLRVGTATAKGMAYALGLPLIAVSTLDALAEAVLPHLSPTEIVMPMIDARRMEVYTSAYRSDGSLVLPTEAVILDTYDFTPLTSSYKTIHVCGNGSHKVEQLQSDMAFRHWDIRCSAAHLAAPGYRAFREDRFADVAYYTPNYVKAPNITQPKKPSFLP